MFEIPDKIALTFGGLSQYQIYKQYNKNQIGPSFIREENYSTSS